MPARIIVAALISILVISCATLDKRSQKCCARNTLRNNNQPKTRFTTEELDATVREMDSLTELRIQEIDSLKRIVTGGE